MRKREPLDLEAYPNHGSLYNGKVHTARLVQNGREVLIVIAMPGQWTVPVTFRSGGTVSKDPKPIKVRVLSGAGTVQCHDVDHETTQGWKVASGPVSIRAITATVFEFVFPRAEVEPATEGEAAIAA